jgi:hypothetical protein
MLAVEAIDDTKTVMALDTVGAPIENPELMPVTDILYTDDTATDPRARVEAMLLAEILTDPGTIVGTPNVIPETIDDGCILTAPGDNVGAPMLAVEAMPAGRIT